MTARTLIAVDPGALAELSAQIAALHARLDAVVMQPVPQWMTVKDYAAHIGRSVDTVRRKIRAGELETFEECGAVMVRVQSSRRANSSAVAL